ncbi:hypothetical protein QUA83_16580 [Microcoleus sp. K1-B1]
MPVSKPIVDSICVEASFIGNLGDVEYRGVHTATREVIFHKRPMSNGTKELAEFLAIVHALAHLNNQGKHIPIYSASETAIMWVRSKNVWTELERSENNEEIFNLMERALSWLKNTYYTNAVLKWDTSSWGEIPAHFGRETQLINQCQQTDKQLETLESSVNLKVPRSIEQRIKIVISGKTYPVKEQLNQAGLSWNGKAWIGALPLDKIENLKKLCRHYDLQYTIKGDGFKESRLARGARPLPSSKVAAVMGEGKFQWEIEETLDIEGLRHRQRNSKDRS